MAKFKLKEILDPSFDLPDNYEDLMQVYRTAAKAADQRLVRLEQISNTENYKNAEQWSYARAMRDIKEWSGSEATRFNVKPPQGVSDLQAKIEDIKTFLRSATSTKKGIRSVHQRRAETLNKKFGTNFTWEDLGKFFNSKLSEDMDSIMGYKLRFKVINTIKKKKKEIIQAIENSSEKDLRTSDNKMVDKLVRKVIMKYGDEVVDFLLQEK